jgi:hypothetical protein
MDDALTGEAAKQKITAAELFNTIVTADMGTLVRNQEGAVKEELGFVYQKAEKVDRDIIDAIVAKVLAAENPPEPGVEEPLEEPK